MSNDYTPPPITTPLGQVVNTKRAQQQRNFAMQPTQLNKSQQWLRDNPIPPAMGIVDELKSMLDPGNMTGANAIQAAIEGEGMSTTERITTGLTGVVQGIGFAAGNKAGEVGVKNVTSAIETGKIVNPKALLENIKARERVIIHASPVKGLTELIPQTGSKAMPHHKVLFGWNPRIPGSGISGITNSLPYSVVKKSDRMNPGSVYVAKVPSKTTKAHVPKRIRNSKKMLVSTEPARVVSEIPLSSDSVRPNIVQTVQQEMRKAGVGVFKTPDVIDNALIKVSDAVDSVADIAKKITKNLRK